MKPALHFPRFGKTLLAAALVAMAGTAAAAGKAIEGDITSAKALAFLYGNLQTTQGEKEQFGMPLSKEWALWKKPQCSNVEYFYLGVETCPQEARVHSVFDAKYTEQGKEKYILLTKTGNAPNMENPQIFGAAVFVKEGGKWTLEVENRYISPEVLNAETVFGCFLDRADTPTLARVGPDKHGILIHAIGSGNQGNSVCPTVLLPDAGSIRSVLIGAFEHHHDDLGLGSGSCEGAQYGKWDVQASFDEQSAGEYYDAIARYTEADSKCRAKPASQRFQFRDGSYHEVVIPKAGKKGAKKRK